MDVQEPSVSAHRRASVKPVWTSLEEAVQMKMEGNVFYKEKNIRSAIGRYHRALLVLRGLDSDVMASVKGFGPEIPALTPEQEASLRSTQVDCYNNLAGRYNHMPVLKSTICGLNKSVQIYSSYIPSRKCYEYRLSSFM